VLAGKAHPQDLEGQAMIRQWIDFIRHTTARSQAVFLSDDDMGLTERLVRGVDVWLNTPRRPWEASGTSGMKVLPNGGLNCSELDGWWAEAYSEDVGWALGDGQEHGDDAGWDAAEATRLYEILEQQVIPEFYTRNQAGIPARWITRIRESMARLTPRFSASRTVREYTEQHYLPLAQAYQERSKDNGKTGVDILKWQRQVEDHWSRLRFGAFNVSTDAGNHTFTIHAWLDELPPDAVAVELYADGQAGNPPVRHRMKRGQPLIGSESGYTWTLTIPADRPTADFTPRIVPCHNAAHVPLECNNILWYR
jgi:starch phosphorylase